MLLFILLRPLVSHRWCIIVDKVMVILDNAAAMPHFITARLHHPQPVRGDLCATSSAWQRCWYTRRRIKSFCCAELRRAAVARDPQKKKQKKKTDWTILSTLLMSLSLSLCREPFSYLETKCQSIRPAATMEGNFSSRSFQVGWDQNSWRTSYLYQGMIAALAGAEEGQKHEVWISPVCCKSQREESCHFLSSMITICFPCCLLSLTLCSYEEPFAHTDGLTRG